MRLLSDHSKERLELRLEAVKTFNMVRDSKPVIEENLKETGYFRFQAIIDDHWKTYSTTIQQIQTAAQDYMNGYDKGIADGIKKGIALQKQIWKDEKEAYKINKDLKGARHESTI